MLAASTLPVTISWSSWPMATRWGCRCWPMCTCVAARPRMIRSRQTWWAPCCDGSSGSSRVVSIAALWRCARSPESPPRGCCGRFSSWRMPTSRSRGCESCRSRSRVRKVCFRMIWPATSSRPICAGVMPTATGGCSVRSAATSTVDCGPLAQRRATARHRRRQVHVPSASWRGVAARLGRLG